ncbi:MAG TPA: response regulator transcription factor [Candidatus Acidoferrales bacterium]|nr:response regulator transcription factor [Candidatus Acidoferrales bacterium]
MTALRILVADDHEVVRRGLRAILEGQPGFDVVGEVGDGWEAVEKTRQLKPDVVIMDISMPNLNGLDATRRIRKEMPEATVLVLTMHDSEQVVREVLDAGARGYLLKSDAGRDLVAALYALRKRGTFFTSKVATMVLEGYLRRPSRVAEHPPAPPGSLTQREREIVQLLGEGKTTKESAAILGMSVKTAETHRANIMRKLNLHSFSELVRYAIRNKIIEA